MNKNHEGLDEKTCDEACFIDAHDADVDAYFATLTESDGALPPDVEKKLEEIVRDAEARIEGLEKRKLKAGMVLDYNRLKKCGATKEEIVSYVREDIETVDRSERFLANNIASHDYHFGYPINMEDYTYLIQYLRRLESRTYVMNNCGDPFQGGNSRMDSKEMERMILETVAENFGLGRGEYWGYLTSGGTEGNYWAIREGFSRFRTEGKKARLYFSEDTHYSVMKFVSYGGPDTYDYRVVPSHPNGSVDAEKLKKIIRADMSSGYDAAILLMNWGTTCKGATDDVRDVVSFCIEENIPYYCHVDAALYGGIGFNQVDAPKVGNIRTWHVDSVSLSLYKYIGAARINGVVLSLKERLNRDVIEYIGMEDSTFLGSRDILPFSTYQRTVDILKRSPADSYRDNIEYLENLLKVRAVPYSRTGNGCVFVIDCPSRPTCKKFQLATFDNDTKAHIIIFPFHKKEIIDELVEAVAKDIASRV